MFAIVKPKPGTRTQKWHILILESWLINNIVDAFGWYCSSPFLYAQTHRIFNYSVTGRQKNILWGFVHWNDQLFVTQKKAWRQILQVSWLSAFFFFFFFFFLKDWVRISDYLKANQMMRFLWLSNWQNNYSCCN